MKNIVQNIKQTLSALSAKEKGFLLAAIFCSYFISVDYAIIRPVSNSLFIQSFGAKSFPWAWILSIPFNFFVVSLYNRFIPKIGCLKMFLIVASFITVGNCLSSFLLHSLSFWPFVFYIWKDLYVMLMFQLLWSVIHTTVELSKAKYLYGLLFAIGALGGLSGSLFASKFAISLGSESLLFFTAPIYILLTISYKALVNNMKQTDLKDKEEDKKTSSMIESISLITRSKLLLAILLMVIFMQITATLTDFQFNTFLEKLYPEKDVRTAYFGKLLGFGNILTISFQLIGVYTLIKYFGKFKTHLFIPIILGLNCLAFVGYPSFGMISYAFLTIKCLDFSLFNVIKEMLYIPLRTEEKFRAKALIDVFMYRGAKVFASFFVMFVQFYFTTNLLSFLSWINLSIFILWMFVVVWIKQFYQEPQQAPQQVQA